MNIASPHLPAPFPNGAIPPHIDPLTQVLESVRLRCMMPSANHMTAPWGVKFGGVSPAQLTRKMSKLGLPPPPVGMPPTIRGSVIAIVRGACWLELPESKSCTSLTAGDVVLLMRDVPFILRDDPRSSARHILDLVQREHVESQRGLTLGGGGAMTGFLCGRFFFEDDSASPLLGVLPTLVHLRGEQGSIDRWLGETVRFLAEELNARQPGAHGIINHLVHVLVIQAVRAYMAHDAGEARQPHGLAALADPGLGAAVGLMHVHPERDWTVASLAEHAGMSRSAFAARFSMLVGRPPLKYLLDCRMRRAREMLREGQVGLKTVAARVGYSTDAAFSNAFRRVEGMTPGAYRKAVGLATAERSVPPVNGAGREDVAGDE